MAKGNLFLGYGRGSVGDVTMSRTKGQQVARARNRQPMNPRTDAQVIQRAKMASAVKFFKMVPSGALKYAFEDKRPEESDYNAFVRHNVSLASLAPGGGYLEKWPAPAPWILSQGSLGPDNFFSYSDGLGSGVLLVSRNVAPEGSAWGEICRGIISSYPQIKNGDYLTFFYYVVVVNSEDVYAEEPDVIADSFSRSFVRVVQVRIDVDSREDDLSLVGHGSASVDYFVQPDAAGLDRGYFWASGASPIAGAAFSFQGLVLSRVVGDRVLVSSSSIRLAADDLGFLDVLQSSAWRDFVLDTWRAEPEALLQGSIAKK